MDRKKFLILEQLVPMGIPVLPEYPSLLKKAPANTPKVNSKMIFFLPWFFPLIVKLLRKKRPFFSHLLLCKKINYSMRIPLLSSSYRITTTRIAHLLVS